jgi:hypothetical protein
LPAPGYRSGFLGFLSPSPGWPFISRRSKRSFDGCSSLNETMGRAADHFSFKFCS